MAESIDILVTGSSGQIGRELSDAKWPESVILHTPSHEELDLADPESIKAVFAARSYDAVINSGAYTAVDKAEDEAALAFGINSLGAAVLADLTRRASIPLIQVSTDYVFDGVLEEAYRETDAVNPINLYGASKLAGELAVCHGNPRSVVIRTAWIVSRHRTNFLKTMLRLAETNSAIKVVDDQYGSPTSATDVAGAIRTVTMRMIQDVTSPTGVYHFVNGGATTWAGLARHIFACSAALEGPTADVIGIPTSEYPTPAKRPANSRLGTRLIERDYGIVPRPWDEAISDIIDDLYERHAA